jgi:hypothetical protein
MLFAAFFACNKATDNEGQNTDEIDIQPCHAQPSDSIITIENMRTKLYFLTDCEDGNLACAMLPEGLVVSANTYVFALAGDNERYASDEFLICNFPSAVLSWNDKSTPDGNGCFCWEDEIEVSLSGIVHIVVDSVYNIKHGTFEITSLRRI